MTDLSHYDRLREAFDGLLRDLAATWPAKDVEYVREEVGYGEYGEALENLVALGFRNGKGFGAKAVGQIESLATAMEMGNAPFLAQLRKTSGQAEAGQVPGSTAA